MLHWLTGMGSQIVWKILSYGNWVMMPNGCEKLSDEWWVMSDGNWGGVWIGKFDNSILWFLSDKLWKLKTHFMCFKWLFGFIFFYHSISITHHSIFHTCLASSPNFHHSIFFTLFVGPYLSAGTAFFFFFFSIPKLTEAKNN